MGAKFILYPQTLFMGANVSELPQAMLETIVESAYGCISCEFSLIVTNTPLEFTSTKHIHDIYQDIIENKF